MARSIFVTRSGSRSRFIHRTGQNDAARRSPLRAVHSAPLACAIPGSRHLRAPRGWFEPNHPTGLRFRKAFTT
jgi:hypothetical protein